MNSPSFGVFGKGLLKNNALLAEFLTSYHGRPAQIQRIYPLISSLDSIDTMLGWGRKKSYQRASRFAKQHGLRMLTLEDGFLRSLDSGKHSRYACSMVIDPIGIYFDAKQPSLLEQIIVEQTLSKAEQQHSGMLLQQIMTERLSKYNSTPKSATLTSLNLDTHTPHILLIDQVAGDQSIKGAGATKKSFANMLKVAKAQHPHAKIWVKAHPAGKLGYLTALSLPSDVQVITDAVNPIELLQAMAAVYTVSSHMGFEALMLGKQVHCFGVPWYAGWGLTDDSHAPKKLYQHAYERRGKQKQPNIIALFDACYRKYSHYANPATGRACQIEDALQWLITNRDWRDKTPSGLTVYEISPWKYNFVNNFLASTCTRLEFSPQFTLKGVLTRQAFAYPTYLPFLVWGFAKKTALHQVLAAPLAHQSLNKATTQAATKASPTIWCMEDGFIRSNGLGASLIDPLSVVIDKTGIYYNALQPSDLEHLLIQQPPLNTQQQNRTQALIKRLLDQQVSKYNVGKHQPLIISAPHATEKILVVGQVEDDMSVKLCGSDIKTNLQLLKTVRARCPHAYIIYKPHPDVQAGLRTGKISASEMQQYANQVVMDISMPRCLDAVDSVHTISSLTGFEALLRGLSVTCYGFPFYAGWGLTHDVAQGQSAQQITARRQRQQPLNLTELVYCTLIQYPLYHLPNQYGLAQVEAVIDFLYPTEQPSAHTKTTHALAQQAIKQTKLGLMKARHHVVSRLLHSDKRQNLRK